MLLGALLREAEEVDYEPRVAQVNAWRLNFIWVTFLKRELLFLFTLATLFIVRYLVIGLPQPTPQSLRDYSPKPHTQLLREILELPRGIEPRTRRLQICCSAN